MSSAGAPRRRFTSGFLPAGVALAVALIGAVGVAAHASKPPLPLLTGEWVNRASPPPRGLFHINGGCYDFSLEASWRGSATHSGLVGSFRSDRVEPGRDWVFAGRAYITEGGGTNTGAMTFKLVTPDKFFVTFKSDSGIGSGSFYIERVYPRHTLSGRPPPGRRWSIENKEFQPPCATVDAGSKVTFCNEQPFLEKLFSYSRYNKFETRALSKGQCVEETAHNPTSDPILFKVFSELHAKMKLTLIVPPA